MLTRFLRMCKLLRKVSSRNGTNALSQWCLCAMFLLFLLLMPRAAMAAGGLCPTGVAWLNPATGQLATPAALGCTSAYYAASNGSDSNDGLSEASGHPLVHFPGMTGCASTCSGITPSNGEWFIYRGGDSIPLTWSWSTNCTCWLTADPSWFSGASFARPIVNLGNTLSTAQPSSCTTSNDSGTALSLGSTTNVTLDNYEFTGACWSAGGNASGMYISGGTGGDTCNNLYIHGWTMATTVTSDGSHLLGGCLTVSYVIIDGSDSTFGNRYTLPSGQCSTFPNMGVNCAPTTGTPTTANSGATGWGISSAKIVHHTIIRHTSNPMEMGQATSIHDNLEEYNFESFNNTQHGNLLETTNGTGSLATPFYFFGNIARNNSLGISWQIQGPIIYFFNDVAENDWHDGGSPNPNCIMFTPNGFSSGSAVVNIYAWNNTIDPTCKIQSEPGGSNNFTFVSYALSGIVGNGTTATATCSTNCGTGILATGGQLTITGNSISGFNQAVTITGTSGSPTTSFTFSSTVNSTGTGGNAGTATFFENWHLVGGFSSITAAFTCGSGNSCGMVDNGGTVPMSSATATTQGYVLANDFQPTSVTNSTVGAGNNMASFCSAIPDATASSECMSGTGNGCSETSGSGGKVMVCPAIAVNARPPSGNWNAGAYQFSLIVPMPAPAAIFADDWYFLRAPRGD